MGRSAVIRVVATILVVLVGAVSAVAQPSAPTGVAEIDRAVVLVSVAVESGGRLVRGSGSGIVIEASGLILTAAHVVNRARSVEVTLWTGETIPARVVGVDPLFDAALIRVESRLPLPTAALGSSSLLLSGATVTALGRSPRRQAGPTSGALIDVDLEARPGIPYLRASTAVWPGDSGGAMVNERGEVIGLIVAITRDGSVSLSVAIDAVKPLMPALLAGSVRHAWLGVSGTTITSQLAQELGLAVRSGVLVFEALPGGPAAQAGLRGGVAGGSRDIPRGGDIIVAIDGRPVASFGALAGYVLSKRIGDTVTVEFIRGTTTFTTTIVLGERPNT